MVAKHSFVAEISLLAHKWLQFRLFWKKQNNSKSCTLIKQSNFVTKIFVSVNGGTLLRLIILSIPDYFMSTAQKHDRLNFE